MPYTKPPLSMWNCVLTSLTNIARKLIQIILPISTTKNSFFKLHHLYRSYKYEKRGLGKGGLNFFREYPVYIKIIFLGTHKLRQFSLLKI